MAQKKPIYEITLPSGETYEIEEPETTIGPKFAPDEALKIGAKRLGSNFLGMLGGDSPTKMIQDLVSFGHGAVATGAKPFQRNPLPQAKEMVKSLSPIQEGQDINTNVGNTLGDAAMFLLGARGIGGKGAKPMPKPAGPLAGRQVTIGTGTPAPMPLKPVGASHSLSLETPNPRTVAGSFSPSTAMKAPSGPIIGLPQAPVAKQSFQPPNRRQPSRLSLTPDEEKMLNEYTAKYAKGQDMRGARAKQILAERQKRDLAKADLARPLPSNVQRSAPSPEEVAEQVGRGVQNDFRGVVSFEKKAPPPAPKPAKRGRPIGDATAQEKGIQKIYEAYNLTKKVERSKRTPGQQKLYDEVGKLLALSRKATGEDVPSGKIANPDQFKEMLRRVGRDERGQAQLKILLPLAGAALGSVLAEDNPISGGVGGALIGGAIANPQALKKGAGALAKGYTNVRREAFLAGAAIPKNIASAVGGAGTLGVEKGTLKPAKELLRLPTNAKEFNKALNNPQRQFTTYSKGGVSKFKYTPSRIISAIDQTTTKAFERAGIDKSDIERVLLTGENDGIQRMALGPLQEAIKTLPQAEQDALLRSGKEILNFVLPFQRTPANMFSQSFFVEAPQALRHPTRVRSLLTFAATPAGAAIGEWASDGDPRKVALAGILLASMGSRSGLGTLGASSAVGRQVFGGVSPIPEMAIDLNTSLVPKPQNFWRRLLKGENPPKK